MYGKHNNNDAEKKIQKKAQKMWQSDNRQIYKKKKMQKKIAKVREI